MLRVRRCLTRTEYARRSRASRRSSVTDYRSGLVEENEVIEVEDAFTTKRDRQGIIVSGESGGYGRSDRFVRDVIDGGYRTRSQKYPAEWV
jgi:hypothetical protein